MGSTPLRLGWVAVAMLPLSGCFVLGEAALEGICGATRVCGEGWGFTPGGASSSGGEDSTSSSSSSSSSTGGGSTSGVVGSSSAGGGSSNGGSSNGGSSNGGSSNGGSSSRASGTSGNSSSTVMGSSSVMGSSAGTSAAPSSSSSSSGGGSSSADPCAACSGVCWGGVCQGLVNHFTGTANWSNVAVVGGEHTTHLFLGGSPEAGGYSFMWVIPLQGYTDRFVTTALVYRPSLASPQTFGGSQLPNTSATGAEIYDVRSLTTAWADTQLIRTAHKPQSSIARVYRWDIYNTGGRAQRKSGDDATLLQSDFSADAMDLVKDFSVVQGDVTAADTRVAILTSKDLDRTRVFITTDDNTVDTPYDVTSAYSDPWQLAAVDKGGSLSMVAYRYSATGAWYALRGATAGGSFVSMSDMGSMPDIPTGDTQPHRPMALIAANNGVPMLLALTRDTGDVGCADYRARFFTFTSNPVPTELTPLNSPCIAVSGPVSWQVVPTLSSNVAYALLIAGPSVWLFRINSTSAGFGAAAVETPLDLTATHAPPVGLGAQPDVTGTPPVVCITRSSGPLNTPVETVTCDRVVPQ